MSDEADKKIELTLKFDWAEEKKTFHPSFQHALVDVMAYFEDFGDDTLPCECRVNMLGQLCEMSLVVGGTLSPEVFPLEPSDTPLRSATLRALSTKTKLDTSSYPFAEGVQILNRKTGFAEITGGVVAKILYQKPFPNIQSRSARFEASQLMEAEQVILGSVRGNRFFPWKIKKSH